MNYRRSTSARTPKKYRRTILSLPESLEAKLPLDASGFTGNDCAPNLDLSAMAVQSAVAGQEFTLDLFAAGATLTDVNSDDTPTGDNLIVQLDPDDNPANATLTSDGMFSWTPNANDSGRFEFIVIGIDDGTPALADAEIFMIDIDAPNLAAPDLADIADVTADVDQEVVVNLSASDADGNNLTFQIDPETQDLASLGATLEQSGTTATLRWTPNSSFAGQSIDFIALVTDDGTPPRSDSERFTITVSDVATTAVNDTFSVSDGASLTVDAANGVLANDTAAANATLTATVLDQPTNGTLVLAADGSFTYTANSGFRGADAFTYQVADGNGGTSTGSVTITINSAPTAADDTYSTDEDTELTIDAATGVLANDSDVDGDAFTATISQSPALGTVVLNDDGSFTYTPLAEANGDVTFTYIIDDGALTSTEATVTISITPVNDAPVAVDESFSATEDTELGVSIAEGVLANDTDVEGDALTATLVNDVTNGTLVLSSDGSLSYTPNAQFSGTDSFTYTVSDGELTSAEATATINVGGENDAPVADLDSYTIAENATLVVDAAAGVLANDTDDDGDTLTAIIVSNPFNGSLSFSSDGSFEYTPNAGFTGMDFFSYRAEDATAESNVANVSIEVTNVNEAPVGTNDAYDVTEDVDLTIDAAAGVLANDTDGDGDTLTVALVDPPTEGMLTLNTNGAFEYQASENSSGTDTFTYEVSDGTLTSQPVTVTLTITTVNDAPVAVNDSFAVAFDPSLNISAPGVLGNDIDAEGSTLTATVITTTTDGTLNLNADGSFTYQPDAGFTGNDSFTYQISDGEATGDATVNIIVTGSNDFSVSQAAAVGAAVGTVVPMTSTPAVFQFADSSLNAALVIDETDHLAGDLSAPVVLIEYIDFSCPHCADAHPVIEQLKQDFAGDLLVVQRHLLTVDANGRAAGRAAEAAAQQGKFQEMADLLFANQSTWTTEGDPTALFNSYASQIQDLDTTQFAADLLDSDLNDRINDDIDVAVNTLSISGTPSFFLAGQSLSPAPTDVAGFTPLIQAEVDTVQGSYLINRETGQITVRDNTNIVDETLSVLVTDEQGTTETIEVKINSQSGSAGGVASASLDDALAGEFDWLTA